jgi:hypothetical protein
VVFVFPLCRVERLSGSEIINVDQGTVLFVAIAITIGGWLGNVPCSDTEPLE